MFLFGVVFLLSGGIFPNHPNRAGEFRAIDAMDSHRFFFQIRKSAFL